MKRIFNSMTMGLLLTLAALHGCGSDPEAVSEQAGNEPVAEVAPPAATLSIPGDRQGAGATSPGGARLLWQVPDGWTEEQPSSRMRLAQYKITGTSGEAICTVFSFGPGRGGDPMSNAMRWAGQFEQADGTPSKDAMRVTQLEGLPYETTLVEVGGTFNGGMMMAGQADQKLAGYLLLGAITEAPDGSRWFFKLTGPESLVRGQKTKFQELLLSLQVAE